MSSTRGGPFTRRQIGAEIRRAEKAVRYVKCWTKTWVDLGPIKVYRWERTNEAPKAISLGVQRALIQDGPVKSANLPLPVPVSADRPTAMDIDPVEGGQETPSLSAFTSQPPPVVLVTGADEGSISASANKDALSETSSRSSGFRTTPPTTPETILSSNNSDTSLTTSVAASQDNNQSPAPDTTPLPLSTDPPDTPCEPETTDGSLGTPASTVDTVKEMETTGTTVQPEIEEAATIQPEIAEATPVQEDNHVVTPEYEPAPEVTVTEETNTEAKDIQESTPQTDSHVINVVVEEVARDAVPSTQPQNCIMGDPHTHSPDCSSSLVPEDLLPSPIPAQDSPKDTVLIAQSDNQAPSL